MSDGALVGPSAWSTAALERLEGAAETGALVRGPASWPVILTMAFACISTAANARRATPPATLLPLETMSFQDAERVGAIGTGCTWKGGSKLAGMVSMADDRAGVRRNGKVIALKPAPDAKELFFTYDRWVAGKMRIVIRDTGKVVRRGHEFSETAAWLDFIEDGRKGSFLGRLSCGS